MKVVYPYKMYFEFSNGEDMYVANDNEQVCVEQAAKLADRMNTEITFYTGVTDDCYIDGELRPDADFS